MKLNELIEKIEKRQNESIKPSEYPKDYYFNTKLIKRGMRDIYVYEHYLIELDGIEKLDSETIDKKMASKVRDQLYVILDELYVKIRNWPRNTKKSIDILKSEHSSSANIYLDPNNDIDDDELKLAASTYLKHSGQFPLPSKLKQQVVEEERKEIELKK